MWAMFVYIRSFDVESRPGQQAVVIVVANVATVVVDIASNQQIDSTRPRNYLDAKYLYLVAKMFLFLEIFYRP